MSRHNINIQDGFLFQSLKEARIMSFDLVTGKRLEGRLKRFDRFAVVVDTGTQEILVYKHAISTITEAGQRS
ncbi:MAG: RNA chaperone Hfq [Acidobacteriota bacterium]